MNSQTGFSILQHTNIEKASGLDFTLNANGEVTHDLINWGANQCKLALIRGVNCLEIDLE